MQTVAVPLSGKDRKVEAYVIRYLKENNMFSTAQTINVFDGASKSVALEILATVGLEAYTLGKPLFIPIDDLMLLGGLDRQCSEPADKIIFVFESKPSQEAPYVEAVKKLRGLGFRFAINYPFEPESDLIAGQCSYIFLSQRPERLEQTEKTLARVIADFPDLTPIATHIYTEDNLNSLHGQPYALYENRFYRVAAETGGALDERKKSILAHINAALDESLDFDKFSQELQGEQQLISNLLGIFNAGDEERSNKIKTIAQAVSVMGQQEVRRWTVAALCYGLAEDKQEEVMRVSLIRALFARNLATLFHKENRAGELFLIGLFSILDIMLDMPMKQAIQIVNVPEQVRDALADQKGECYAVLEMMRDYENANWSSVSRHMIIHDIEEEKLARCYVDALAWYRNLIQQEMDMDRQKEAVTK